MSYDMNEISKKYDELVPEVGLYHEFYEFAAQACTIFDIPKDANIMDIGCGSGLLLIELEKLGYRNLSGVDLSTVGPELAKKAVPTAKTWSYNLLEGPLPAKYDVIFMTEVIEHLTDPILGLQNIYESLSDNGWLFLTFPNKFAFFPGYLLKPLVDKTKRWKWVNGWLNWFFLPYEMHTTQPIDHAYGPKDIEHFLSVSHMRVITRRGMRFWPMFRIWDWSKSLVQGVENTFRPIIPTAAYYRLMYISRKT